jgi:hypothetical protein
MPAQLSLEVDQDQHAGEQRWTALPPAAREQALVLLARLIARGVLVDDEETTS